MTTRVANLLTLHEHVVTHPGRTRGHNKKLYVKKATHSIRRNVLAYRVNDIWNDLPSKIVNAPSLNSFKNQLDLHWVSQELKFNYTKSYSKIIAVENEPKFG